MSAAPTPPKNFNPERLMTLILAPVVSEKSTRLADTRTQMVLRVTNDATKPEVKAAVEWLFKVEVESVSMLNVHGKEKRFGRTIGRRRGWKKAYVNLKTGQEINYAQEV